MKAALYARVSTQEQAEGKFSIQTQIDDCTNHCQRQGDDVAKTYVDVQSGRDARKDRAQFVQMLNDTRAGVFDKIVVWRPDRIFRGLTPAAKLARILDETGVSIEGVLQPLDRRMIGLWAWVAEQEIEGMKERFRAGKRANARELGKWGGGPTKYGYKYNANKRSPDYTGLVEIDEQEASVVRSIFEWVDQGKTAASWCRWANSQGIPTKRNSLGWTPQEVSEKLREKAYTGRGVYGRLIKKGEKLVKSDNPVSLTYPRIIEDDLFERVQRQLAENTRKNKSCTKRVYPLQHLGKCGVCGGTLCFTTQGTRRYVYCLNQRRFPHIYQCHKPQNRNLTMIEDYIWAEVEDALNNYRNNTYDRLLDRFESAKGDRQEQMAKAKAELERCQLERQRVLTQVRKGWVTDADAELQFRAVREEEEHWQTELDNLTALADNTDSIWESFWTQLKATDKMFDYGFVLSPERKKELLSMLLEQFVLYKDGKIELRFKVPVNDRQIAETVLTLSSNVVSLPHK